MKERTLAAIGVLALLSAPVRAGHIQVPAAPAPAPALFAPAPASWGPAFAGVSRFLGTEAGAALSLRHPFLGDLKGYDAASPEALSVVAPMAEAIAAGHPSFHQHMARVAELDETEQKLVLAVVAYAQQKGAKAVEAKVAAEIERALALGDLEALKVLARQAPAYSVYGGALQQGHVRAFVLAEETARLLRDGKGAGDGLEPGAVLGRTGTPAAPLARSARGEIQAAAPGEPAAPSAPRRAGGAVLDGAALGLLGGGLSYLFFAADQAALGWVMAVIAALGGLLALASALGLTPDDDRYRVGDMSDWNAYQADREAARLDAKWADHNARRGGDGS